MSTSSAWPIAPLASAAFNNGTRNGWPTTVHSAGPPRLRTNPTIGAHDSSVEPAIIAPTKDWRSVVGISEMTDFSRLMQAEMDALRDADRRAAEAGQNE